MIVKPVGPKDAKIMLIGEAPGVEEELSGKPFIGGSGKILNGLLRDAGISREECYLTNVMQVRPVNNDFGNFYEDKSRNVPRDILLEGIERLKNEIVEVNPNIVVPLGNEPLKALTGLQKITKRRGSIYEITLTKKTFDGKDYDESYKVLPTMHPAAVMRFWEYRPLVLFDLKRVLDESALSTYKIHPRLWEKVEDIPKLRARVKDFLENADYISFDIETCNNQVSCISFARTSTFAFTVPICIYDKSFWTPEEELIVWQLIKQLLESPIKKIAQNANFDMFFLWTTVGIKVKNLWMDTMNAHHCVYPELPKALDLLCSIYTDQPYYKDMVKEDIYHYNCLDSMVTYECAMRIEEQLKEFGVHKLYHEHTHPIIQPLLEMQIRGCRIDMKKKALAAESTRENIMVKQKQLDEAVGYVLNVNSPKQMKAFLYDDLKLPPVISRKTGKITTDETALKKLSKTYPNPIFDLVIHVRGQRKLLSTYLEASTDPDGRFRCRYILFGTETGRLASKLSWTDTGGNLQNVPKGIAREIFIPDEGKMFMSGDLSQADARVVAYLANEPSLIKIFESGGDIHRKVASIMFNKEESDVTPDERQTSKHICHAANYGMGAYKLAERWLTKLSVAECEEKLNLFHVHFPKIRIWHMAVEAQLKKTRVLITPMGRKRMFFGRWDKAMLRDAYAYVPQSTVADVCLKGMVNLYKNFCAYQEGYDIVFNIHDEIVIQIPVHHADSLDREWVGFMKAVLIDCMSIPLTIEGKTFTIPVGIKTGMNWNEVS